MPETLGESMPPSPTVGASVQKRKAEDRLETDIQQRSRRRARHAREYELICLLQQRSRAVSWPHWSLSAACSHCSAAAWDLSGLDHSHAATPQRVTRASCAQLLRSDFCAWRRLLLICWKLLIGVCVRDGLAASVCVYRTSAASVELRPRGWRAVAFPRWLHDQSESGSTWLIVILIVRCCFGGLCVRDGLAASLRMSHFSHGTPVSSVALARNIIIYIISIIV